MECFCPGRQPWLGVIHLSDQAQPTTAQFERNARIFDDGLMAWREWLVSLQEQLCSAFVVIALANRATLATDPLDWVSESVRNFWIPRRIGFQNWVKVCCDRSDADDWLAPGWLLKQIPDEPLKELRYPAEVGSDGRLLSPITSAGILASIAEPSEEMRYSVKVGRDGRVLSPVTSAGILVSIANLIVRRLEIVKSRVLDETKIKIASEPSPASSAPSAFLIERVNDAANAIHRKYGDKWDAKWYESTRELYAALHPANAAANVGDVAKPPSTRRPGRPPLNPKRYEAIAIVVESFGDNWPDRLDEIVEKLDKKKIAPSEEWKDRQPPARTWARAFENFPDAVKKAIDYALKQAAKNSLA
jgi:hypothetical protein